MNNINRNSWHYKFWKFCGGMEKSNYTLAHINVSICGYVQRIFWVGLFLLAVAGACVTAFGYMLFWIGRASIHHPMIAGIALVAAGFVVIFGRYMALRKSKMEHGIVYQWVKAKKDRVCPLVTFETK